MDDQATGVQRFATEMILALERSGVKFELLIGEMQAIPAWMNGRPHRTIFGRDTSRRWPRAIIVLARILWLQFVFPHISGRRKTTTLLSLAGELAPWPRVRQIGVAHDLTDFHEFSQRRGLGLIIRNKIWAAGLRRSAATIAISNATREDVLRVFDLPPARVHVVFEGFDPKIFRPAAPLVTLPAPYLLYVGTLDPHKNLKFALEVFARLRGQGHSVTFRLAGRHDKKRVAELKITIPGTMREYVDFIGFVSDDELARLMQNCAVFIFPSRNEGFGLAPVEAMACGAPVIAAAAGSLIEVIGDGGVLLDPDDTESWVYHVGRLLVDPAYNNALSTRALARSRFFSWDQAAAEYEAIINAPDRPAAQTVLPPRSSS